MRRREERVVKIRVSLQDWNGNNSPGKDWQNLFSGYRDNLRTEDWLLMSDFLLITLQSVSAPCKNTQQTLKTKNYWFLILAGLPVIEINQGIAQGNRTTWYEGIKQKKGGNRCIHGSSMGWEHRVVYTGKCLIDLM